MWFEIRVLGAEDWFGDACEHGGWALVLRTNDREHALSCQADAIAEYGSDLVDLEVC